MQKPYIIAEIGVNYYDIAKKEKIALLDAARLMIKKAAESGADVAKFQSYKAGTLASKNSPSYWDLNAEPTTSQHELFQKFDKFGQTEYVELADYAKSCGIDFASTPFDFESVDYLDKLMPFFKIASADITNLPFLKYIAQKNKPIYLSTGASTLGEIDNAIQTIQTINPEIEISLLHCVLSYPTKNENANLNRIKHLKRIFPKYKIGYSDHALPDETMTILTTAYLFGAEIIEKHFTLDKNLTGNDHYHAMDPEDLAKFCRNVETLEQVLSKNAVNYLGCEKMSRKQARRSLVLTQDVSLGEEITAEKLTMKRPGTGISPEFYDLILNKKVNKALTADYILQFEDFLNL